MTAGPDYEAAMQDFKRGGWITALFGGAGMLARLLVTDEAHPAIWWTRRILASVIIGVLSYFAVWPLLTFSGMAGPELIDWVIRQFRNAPDLNAKKRKTKAKRR
jgi:hypothetical protein